MPAAARASAMKGLPRLAMGRAMAVVILSAYPGRAAAERAARELVAARVVACATVAYGAKAFYRWNGKDRAGPSTLLWGKTTRAKAAAAVRAIREGHPDEVPEILVLPVIAGHAPYLAWMAGEVKGR
jgi:periplasmic divalent cation tolerance protein